MDRELAALGGDLGVEHDLEEQIAQLLSQVFTAGVDRLQNFVCFFDEIRLERRRRLFAIPRAPARSAELRHDSQEVLEEGTGGLGHVLT